LFFDAEGDMVKTLNRDPTLTGRTALWDELLEMNENPAFGNGFETFWMGTRIETIWRKHWWHPQEAHNGYIEVFLNLGWAGLALLILVTLTGYFRAVGALRSDLEIGGLKVMYIIVALVYSSGEAGFRLLTPVWISFLFGALAVSNRPVLNPIPATAEPAAPEPQPVRVRPLREPQVAFQTARSVGHGQPLRKTHLRRSR